MTDTSPGSTTHPADFTRAPAIDARAALIDLGLIDAVTVEILAHPMALSDPPLSNPPNLIFNPDFPDEGATFLRQHPHCTRSNCRDQNAKGGKRIVHKQPFSVKVHQKIQ